MCHLFSVLFQPGWDFLEGNLNPFFTGLLRKKSANTLKKLIVYTKAGSISYISDAYGGAASDRFITEDCGVVRKFIWGMVFFFF